MKSRFVLIALLLLVLCGVTYAQVFREGGAANAAYLTTEVHLITFAGATSGTAATQLKAPYYPADAWVTSSADPGKVVVSVSNGTATVTTANATTGTYCLHLTGRP